MVSLSIFSLLTWYPFIISYSSIPSFKSFTAPLHLPLSSPYKVHSNNTCFSVSTSPHRYLSSSYFHVILSLPLTGKHPPLIISLTPAPTFPSAKLSFLGHSFICTPYLYYGCLWKGLLRNRKMCMFVSLTYSKAFDTVKHKLLVDQLQSLDVDQAELRLLTSLY